VWGNKNSIKLWSRNLNGRCCFGDLCTDGIIKLKCLLQYIGCEFVSPHRVQWRSVVNTAVNWYSIKRELLYQIVAGQSEVESKECHHQMKRVVLHI
jgi:hypothetical protein